MMHSDSAPGGAFPNYQLPDHTQTIRKLSELQRDDPLKPHARTRPLLPEDHQQHLQLAVLSQIAVA